jgi:hypothetical protein
MDIYTRIDDGMSKVNILIMLEKLGIEWADGRPATRFIPEAPFLVLCNSGSLAQSSSTGSQEPVDNRTFLMLAEQRVRAIHGSISPMAPMAFDESLAKMYVECYMSAPIPQGEPIIFKPVTRVSSKASRRRDVLLRLSID